MSLPSSLFGESREIPETDEIDYGDPLSELLFDITEGLNALVQRIGTTNYVRHEGTPTGETFTAAQVLSVTKPLHVGAGTPGAVTITLANGTHRGQLARIMCTHATNTITIVNSGNMLMRSDVTLELGESILLMWIGTGVTGISNKWVELSRST